MTSKYNYPKGNEELLTMIQTNSFNPQRAKQIITEIPDLDQPILDFNNSPTNYLIEASKYNNNIEAVKFLLENGADPNYCNDDLFYIALNDLHFLWEEIEEQSDQRLEITKLFFEFGGDPNLIVDGETLYDHVCWELFNDSITPHQWEYLSKFFLILIAYGGGGGICNYPKPQLTEPIDKTQIDRYTFRLFECADKYHLEGHIFNPDGIDIGKV